MEKVVTIILYSLCSGLTILIGALFAKYLTIKNRMIRDEFIHTSIAFGGGVLIAAIAFALTPKAIKNLDLLTLAISFLLGSLIVFSIDKYVISSNGSLAQVMGMLMDFIPEAIALGASFAHDTKFGLLLAVYIGLQNLPEGFNSYMELIKRGNSHKKAILILLPLSFIGVFSALMGDFLLTDKPKIIAILMIFSSGGLIYLMFQDIAPLSKIKNNWFPALGASLGFLVGMIGEKIILY